MVSSKANKINLNLAIFHCAMLTFNRGVKKELYSKLWSLNNIVVAMLLVGECQAESNENQINGTEASYNTEGLINSFMIRSEDLTMV